MELTRIIHPVGQGGFYSETLKYGSDEINVIYDCGGNDKTAMTYYLDNYYPNKTRAIDAVFISHLHDDHINGLEHLLKNYNVKYLFLPQMTSDEQLEVLLFNSIVNGSGVNANYLFLLDLMNNDDSLRQRETKIIRVQRNTGEGEGLNMEIDDNNSYEISGYQINNNVIKSGSKIHFNKKWFYIPYNPPLKIRKNIGFFDFFKRELNLVNFELEELPNVIYNVGIDTCKKVYEKYFDKNHNAYSMVLFSGTVRFRPYLHCCDECIWFHRKIICPHHRLMYKKNGFCGSPNCLYTGDFDIEKFDRMQSFYKPFWETIGSIQVPHHGSRNNYSPELYEYAHRGFISVGERNKYHHPNVDTLIGIQGMDCNPVIVTESLSTMKMYHYLL